MPQYSLYAVHDVNTAMPAGVEQRFGLGQSRFPGFDLEQVNLIPVVYHQVRHAATGCGQILILDAQPVERGMVQFLVLVFVVAESQS